MRLRPTSARRTRCAAALVLLAGLASGQDDDGPTLTGLAPSTDAGGAGAAAGKAFVELDLARDTFLVGEPFALRVRIGLERTFRSDQQVQLFQQRLDLPVQLHAGWLERPDGMRRLGADDASGAGVTFVVEESVERAVPAGTLERDGLTFQLFEYAPRFLGTRPGEVTLDAPVVRLAWTTRFEEDFVNGRRAVDRVEARVKGTGTRITILPPPEEGRPRDFSGAIGRFALDVEAEPRELAVGQALALTVRVRALDAGVDLAGVSPPALGDLPGFHVRGVLPGFEEDVLVVRYDLAPRDPTVAAVPPVSFAYFDTTPPAGYRTLRSEPIPITVRPERRAESPGGADPGARGGESVSLGLAAAVVVGVAVLAALVLAALLHRRSGGGGAAS